MTNAIRVLIVEDSEDDALLLVRELQCSGYDPSYQRVDTAASMEAALADQEWDIVLADQKMPLFSGLDALELLKSKRIDLPLILVSGATREEASVTAFKAGAHDFVLKNMLVRLVPALERALKEAELRRERRHAITALQDSEERYRRLIELCPDAILISRDGHIAFINSAGLKLLKAVDPQHVLGKPLSDFLHPDCRMQVQEKLRQAVGSTEALSAGEQSILSRDGTLVAVEMTAAPFPDNGCVSVQIVWRDITERRRAAERLQASEERLRQLAENIREVFWMTDPAKKQTLYVSPAYEQIWGRPCENLYQCPQDWMEAIHPADKERVREAALTKQATGQYAEIYRIVRPDGSVRWIEDRAFPIRTEAGEVYRIVGIAQDITSRMQATEALRESEERFRRLFEAAPIGMALHGADGKYIQTNQTYQKMLGYSGEELLQLSVRKLTHPDDVAEGKRLYEEFRAGKRDFYQREKRYFRKSGGVVWARAAASVVRNNDGQLRFIISMVRDITEQKRAADRSAVLARLGHRLSAAATPAEAARIIVGLADELFGWDACYLHLYSAQRDRIIPVLTIDTIAGKRADIPVDNFTLDPSPLMLEVMHNGARLINREKPSFALEGMGVLAPFGDKTRPSASMMYAPIRHASKIIGILSIQSYLSHAYSQQDLDALQVLADHCAGALERMNVETTLRETEMKNRLLLDAIPHWMLRIAKDGVILDYKAPKNSAPLLEDEALAGKKILEVCAQGLGPQLAEHLNAALRQGEPQTFEFQYRQGRSLRDFEAQVVASGTEEVLAIIRDVSERKRLEKEILEISAREQRRIGHDLHDGLGPYLGGVAFKAKILEEALIAESSPHTAETKELVRLINNAIRQSRSLARNLAPIEVETYGLVAALQRLAEETQDLYQVKCLFKCDPLMLSLEPTVSLHLYRIAQEAMNNAIKHGKAQRIEIELAAEPSPPRLIIRDDGKGFVLKTKTAAGMGLRTMRYRAHSIGGLLKIDSRPKHGTEVQCLLPPPSGSADPPG